MAEADITNKILKEASRMGARLFRQNVALAWVGKVVRKTPDTITLQSPRPLHAGLCVGSSDVIGWTPVVVTREMVGQTVAVFTAVEVKTARVPATAEQKAFVAAVREAGGLACIARSVEDALATLRRE